METLPEHVGLDFGNHTVKAVQLTNVNSAKPRLVNFGSQPTPHGVINSEDETHQNKLADALKELYRASKITEKNVVMALPEYSVFTRFSEYAGIKEEEIPNAVYYEAKQILPIPQDEVHMSCIKIGYDADRNVQKVLIVAAPIKIVEIYQNVAYKAGLEPIAIETESIAMGRAMYRATGLKQVLMLDFGAQSTDMSIMADGAMVFSQSISIGSDSLTQAIVNQFSFEYTQAEEYKRNYGLIPNALEGKILNAIKPVMDSIIVEIQRGMEFYKSRTLMQVPRDCLLTGDGSLLPGLAQYITNSLGVSANIADPWTNIEVDQKFAAILSKNKPSFAVAIGLALRNT